MELKHVQISYLLISVLIHGVIVSCQNVSEPTSNPGGELSVQSLHETTSTSKTTKDKTSSTLTTPPLTVAVAVEITSHPAVTSSPVIELMTSSVPIKAVEVVSEDAKQVMTTEVWALKMTTTLMLTSHPVVLSLPVMMSSKPKVQMSVTKDLEQAITTQVESIHLRSTTEPIMMSDSVATSSSVKELVTSSKSLPEIEAASLSSTAKPIVMSSSVVTSSPIMEPLKPSTPVAIVDVVTEKEMSSSEVLKIEPSTIHDKQETSSSKMLKQTLSSSSSSTKQILFSQSAEKMTSFHASKVVTSSQIVSKTRSQTEEEITSSKALKTAMLPTMPMSSSENEEITPSQALEIVTSFQNEEALATSKHNDMRSRTTSFASVPSTSSSQIMEALMSQTVDVLMFVGITNDMTTPQPTKTAFSTSSSHIIQAVTSSQVKTETGFSSLHTSTVSTSFWATDITSLQPLKTSPAVTEISSSYKEMKAFKTTLTFSSSQLADVNATTTEKSLGSSPSQLPTDSVMTSPHSSPSVSITTLSKNVSVEHSATASGTEHYPTHPTHDTEHEDTHATHTYPDESHPHSTHKSHDEHVIYHTMGYPHEPDVDAATGGKNKNDDNWLVSILVVFALLGGMVLFVVVMVIKDRARTGGANLKAKKRPAIGDDNGFVPLKELKVEKEPKLTHAEKRNSQRYSYHGNPEDAVPLLELHIREGEPPLLNAHDESQDTQHEDSVKKGKPLLDVYGDNSTSMSSGKSKEEVSEVGFI